MISDKKLIDVALQDIREYSLPIQIEHRAGCDYYDVYYKNRWCFLGSAIEVRNAVTLACMIKDVDGIGEVIAC